MKLPHREQFQVNKLNKQPKGGLSIDYTAMFQHGEDDFLSENDKKTSERAPTDEFLKLINSLRPFVAKILNYADIRNMISETEFKTNDKQSKYITNLYNEHVSTITINGIQLWATGKLITACSINYSLEGFSSQSMDHKTYKIDLEGEISTHGFEDELRDICTCIVDEAFEYIYNNNGAQLTAFDN